MTESDTLDYTTDKQIKQKRYNRPIFLWLALAILMLSCLYRYVEHHTYVNKPIIASNINALCLDDKINPNRASWSSLARLPGIGETRARALVEYREKNRVIFKSSSDLIQDKGIGEKTADKIGPYLIFDN